MPEEKTEECCAKHRNVRPKGVVSIETERFGGVDRISIRLKASHPCGIDGYSVSVTSDLGGGMRERVLREDVAGMDCASNKDLEVVWDIGPTGSGRATSNIKGKPISESSFMARESASDFQGRDLDAQFDVTSCCDTKSSAEIKIAALTFRPPIKQQKNLA